MGPLRWPRGNLLPAGPWRAPGLFLSLRRTPSSRRDHTFAVTSPLQRSASEVSLSEAPSPDTGSWSSAGLTAQMSQLGCLSLHPPTRGVDEALSGPRCPFLPSGRASAPPARGGSPALSDPPPIPGLPFSAGMRGAGSTLAPGAPSTLL